MILDLLPLIRAAAYRAGGRRVTSGRKVSPGMSQPKPDEPAPPRLVRVPVTITYKPPVTWSSRSWPDPPPIRGPYAAWGTGCPVCGWIHCQCDVEEAQLS